MKGRHCGRHRPKVGSHHAIPAGFWQEGMGAQCCRIFLVFKRSWGFLHVIFWDLSYAQRFLNALRPNKTCLEITFSSQRNRLWLLESESKLKSCVSGEQPAVTRKWPEMRDAQGKWDGQRGWRHTEPGRAMTKLRDGQYPSPAPEVESRCYAPHILIFSICWGPTLCQKMCSPGNVLRPFGSPVWFS